MKTDYECAEIIDDSDEEYVLLPKIKTLLFPIQVQAQVVQGTC